MITAYTGTPGSGKSLHSIRRILQYLKAGKQVIANFPIKVNNLPEKHRNGRYFYVKNEQITVDYLYQFATMYHPTDAENQTLVMIDEASIKFNCRTYSSKDRLAFCDFFAQHRKLGYDIVLVCQNLRQLDRQIRDNVEIELVHRKLNRFSFFMFLPFPLFVAIERNKAINNEKNGSEFFLYSKKVGSLYDTFYDFSGTKNCKANAELAALVLATEITAAPSTTYGKGKKRRTARHPDGVPKAGPRRVPDGAERTPPTADDA